MLKAPLANGRVLVGGHGKQREIRDLPTLSTTIARLEQLPNVISVKRKG